MPRRGRGAAATTSSSPSPGRARTAVTFRKARVLGIWVNADSRAFENAPSYLAVLSNRPLDAIANARNAAPPAARPRQRCRCRSAPASTSPTPPATIPFRVAFIRIKSEHGLYREVVERRHVPHADAVPRLDPAAGRGAGRHLRGRRQAVRRRRTDRARALSVRGLQSRVSSRSSPTPRATTACSTASPPP